MALTVTSLGSSQAATDTPTLSLSGLTSGDVIVVAIVTRFSSQTMSSPPSGYTAGPSGLASAYNAYVYWKISNGTETSVSATLAASSTCLISAVKISGFTGTATLDGTPGEDETNLNTITGSGGFGSVTTSNASAAVIALLFSDAAMTEPTVSGYSQAVDNDLGSGNVEIHYKILSSAGTETPTWTSAGSDENYGAILAFGDVAGGGGFKAAWARGCNTVLKRAA